MRLLLVFMVGMAVACGSRSSPGELRDRGPEPALSPERCNGLDDDGVGGVDDPFRDGAGRYLHDAHCGACGAACAPRSAYELSVQCQLLDDVPRCVATECAALTGPTRDGRCQPLGERLCLPCVQDSDCGALRAAQCLLIGGEHRCSVACDRECPAGYTCDAEREVCLPQGGSCACGAGQSFDFACSLDPTLRPEDAGSCVGHARCEDGVATACEVGSEVCDEQDNDCDGEVDEDFRDALGVYATDPRHCGQCGASCLDQGGSPFALRCGGDPFVPRCVVACPDALDGISVGDRLDGDLDIATGCECLVSALQDAPGPLGAAGEQLDQNCDGADGNVLESFYVAVDGQDDWPGSPTRPLRSLATAVARARASLDTDQPRPHVFVASGSYTETLVLEDGVSVYGGYRRDFRALDPRSYGVEVRAPRAGSAPAGAALVASDVGATATRVAWLSLRGLDATAAQAAALGAYLERPGPALTLEGLTIRAGVPGDGAPGSDGQAGSSPVAAAGAGEAPREAREDAQHQCLPTAVNQVAGGAGGRASCADGNVSGGAGGAAGCPSQGGRQGAGLAGRAVAGPGGAGGPGGQDATGPIEETAGCLSGVCCGLADFEVPTDFQGPSPGENGADGRVGAGGAGCGNPLGAFQDARWQGARGAFGADGRSGAGGGGGGAGGGVEMTFYDRVCEFNDGIGGGGGGGGAGGCGGLGGAAGFSGAPSVAMLVISPGAFSLRDVTFVTADGGRGGAGGAGGDGGLGGAGAPGGALPPEARVTPTLAAPYPGGRGGSGGAGGAGGGGGGGCGGAAVGLWVVGQAPVNLVRWRDDNHFELGAGGAPGAGGPGGRSGQAGAGGEALNVVLQP